MFQDPEKGRIETPCSLTAQEKLFIRRNMPSNHKDWSKSMYSNVKDKLRRYYSNYQDDYCAYCRTRIAFYGYGEPLEHIVDKKNKKDWMFEPINLVLACRRCNTIKGTKQTLNRAFINLTNLPLGSQYYKIAHPHFDNYEDHIVIDDQLFYRAITSGKGLNTIKICGLWRMDIVVKRAREINLNKVGLYSKATHRINDLGTHNDERIELKNLMLNLINRRKL